MRKKVMRMKPSDSTLRKLYVNSGNQCAFTGCTEKIVDENGVFIAQVCHIEAANEGGQRFNPEMSNKERSAYSNLLLLCYKHHKVTDNEEIYSVELLKKIKLEHEEKFENILVDMSASALTDITKSQISIYPKSLKSINTELKWHNSQEELQEAIKIMIDEIDKLARLTPATRSVFLTMLERSEDNVSLLSEILDTLKLSPEIMAKHIDILIKYNLIDKPEFDEEYSGLICEFSEPDGWPIWEDIVEYWKKSSVDLTAVIIDLRFDLLD